MRPMSPVEKAIYDVRIASYGYTEDEMSDAIERGNKVAKAIDEDAREIAQLKAYAIKPTKEQIKEMFTTSEGQYAAERIVSTYISNKRP